MGDVYYDRNNPDSAKICFDQAYKNGLRNGSFLQLMASLYENLNRNRATELYKLSLGKDSTLIGSYRKLAELDPSNAERYQTMLRKWSKSN